MPTNWKLCFICQKRPHDAADNFRCKECAGELAPSELANKLAPQIHKALVEFGYTGLELDYVRERVEDNLLYDSPKRGDIISMMSRSLMEQANIKLGEVLRGEIDES